MGLGDGCQGILFSTYQILLAYSGGARANVLNFGVVLSTYPLGARMVGMRRLGGIKYVGGGRNGAVEVLLGVKKAPGQVGGL